MNKTTILPKQLLLIVLLMLSNWLIAADFCVEKDSTITLKCTNYDDESEYGWSVSAGSTYLSKTDSGDCWATFQGDNPGEATVTLKKDGEDCKSVTVQVFEFELKKVEFTSDHGVLTDYNTDYDGSGGTTYDPRGWEKDGENNPITHTKDSKTTVNATFVMKPSGLDFKLDGSCSETYLTFSKDGITSTGADQTVSITSDGKLPNKVDVIENKEVEWEATVCDTKKSEKQKSGPHKIFVTYDTPKSYSPVTLKRITYATDKAKGKSSVGDIISPIHTHVNSFFNLNASCYPNGWKVLDGGGAGHDCRSLSECKREAVGVLGIAGSIDLVFPSTDNNVSSPETRADPDITDTDGDHGTETLRVYDGGWNNYEACYKANGTWYLGGINSTQDTALKVLQHWLTLTGVKQGWRYTDSSGNWQTNTAQGPYPVPGP